MVKFAVSNLLNSPSPVRSSAAESIFTATIQTELTMVSLFGGEDTVALLYHVPKGETQGEQHVFFRGAGHISAYVPEAVGLGVVLNEGDSLWVSAEGTGVFPMAYGATADENPEINV